MEKIILSPQRGGKYYGRIWKAESGKNKKGDKCQLQFIMTFLVGRGNKDENGDYYKYSAYSRKYYTEQDDAIKQVAQQKELVNVISNIFGLSQDSVTSAILPDVPFDTCCDFYNHVANYINNCIEEFNIKDKPFVLEMEQTNGTWFVFGERWIAPTTWDQVPKYTHDDIINNRTPYELINKDSNSENNKSTQDVFEDAGINEKDLPF